MIENKIYNPAAQPKEWLIENFVVRTNVFEKIFKDIKEGDMKYPEQHYIIQGQRGMGKTTLLLRLKYEIENTPKLNKWLLPVFFTEEMYDLTTLSNLWEKLLIYLDNQFGSALYKETDKYIGTNDYEKRCFELLISALKSNQKKLILFFDNFGELFLDNLNDKDQHRLREVLMNCAEIRIIGASAIVLADLYNYSKPFYEFFKIINLEGLNKDETFQLIKKLEEKSEHPINLEKSKAKIETLAILTGGVIRTVMLIYEAILADQDGSALKDLETILDKITPLYKHRMEVFPPAQRKIIDVIAKKWDAISTKEISESIRENGQLVPSKNISAQLQQLEKNNIIEKKQTNTKNNLYQLKERFFNIWYLMRHGDKYDQCRVKWLTKFLELWYEDEKGFNGFLNEHFLHLRSGNYHANSALMISEALVNSEHINILNLNQLINETLNALPESHRKLLPNIDKKRRIGAAQGIATGNSNMSLELLNSIKYKTENDKICLVILYMKNGEIDLAQKIINSINVTDEENKLQLGIIYSDLGLYEKSNELLINYNGNYKNKALEIIGINYMCIKNNELAKKYLLEAIELGNINAYKPFLEILLVEKDYLLVVDYCLQGIKKGKGELNKILIYSYLINSKLNKKEEGKEILKIELINHPNDPDYNFLKGLSEYFDNEFNNAIKYLLKANKFFEDSKLFTPSYSQCNLIIINILIKIKPDKDAAINFINKIKKIGTYEFLSVVINLYDSFVAIWDNKIEEGINLLQIALKKKENNLLINSFVSDQEDPILLLISKNQYHSVLKIFENEELNFKEKFKPIYYALMHYLKDEYPNEYLKMGDELKQPVEDVMKRVEEMKVLYK